MLPVHPGWPRRQCLPGATNEAEGKDHTVSAKTNQELIKRLALEVLTNHNLDKLEHFFHADYVEADPAPGMGEGVQGMRQWLGMWIEAFPDARWTVEEQISDDNQVWSRSTWRGTHKGDFLGIPATGREVSVSAWTIDRITDGRIAHSRLIMDALGLMQQLGAIPA
jgi:steroid delta-isomerase-like uncharacterized protein